MYTIIHKENDKTEIYHGLLLEEFGDWFKFGFRVDGRNYIWNCDRNYWRLVKHD